MDMQIILTQNPTEEEVFTIETLLGEGKFQVYTAYSKKQQTRYALKVFPSNSFGDTFYKKELNLACLNHHNIIKYFPITDHNGDFNCILIEFAQFGDFLQLTMKNAFQSETLIRTYFHQLIEGMEYLHSQGIAHLDLKFDNLVLGSDFKLKIIDFDQAQSIKGTKIYSGGSKNYRPPEVIDGKCKNLAAVDVYSAGIILYSLVAREFPFYETTDSKGIYLKHYSTFVKDKSKFWTTKASRYEKKVFSEDLIELLNEMMEADPSKRMKVQDIKDSKWYQGPVIEGKKLSTEMKTVLDSISEGKAFCKIA